MTVLDREAISAIALAVIRKKEGDPGIVEETQFWRDLRIDRISRRGYFPGIKDKVKGAGARLKKITAADFEDAVDVKAIVDMVFENVAPANG